MFVLRTESHYVASVFRVLSQWPPTSLHSAGSDVCWASHCSASQFSPGTVVISEEKREDGPAAASSLGCDPEQAPKLLLLRVLPHQGQHLIQKAPAGNERSGLQDLKKSPKQIQELTFKYRAVCTACIVLFCRTSRDHNTCSVNVSSNTSHDLL